MNEDIRELVCELAGEESIVFDNPDYDDAIVGVSHDGRVVYNFDKMVDCLAAAWGISELEAVEFIDYNTIRAIPYAGELAPIVMSPIRQITDTPFSDRK